MPPGRQTPNRKCTMPRKPHCTAGSVQVESHPRNQHAQATHNHCNDCPLLLASIVIVAAPLKFQPQPQYMTLTLWHSGFSLKLSATATACSARLQPAAPMQHPSCTSTRNSILHQALGSTSPVQPHSSARFREVRWLPKSGIHQRHSSLVIVPKSCMACTRSCCAALTVGNTQEPWMPCMHLGWSSSWNRGSRRAPRSRCSCWPQISCTGLLEPTSARHMKCSSACEGYGLR